MKQRHCKCGRLLGHYTVEGWQCRKCDFDDAKDMPDEEFIKQFKSDGYNFGEINGGKLRYFNWYSKEELIPNENKIKQKR